MFRLNAFISEKNTAKRGKGMALHHSVFPISLFRPCRDHSI